MKGEKWDDIPYLDGAYEISSFGRVKSNRRFVERSSNGGYWVKEKIIKPRLSKELVTEGTRTLYRLSAMISYEGRKRSVSIARIVYYLFKKRFDLSDRTLVVSMKDENSLNINPKNLVLISPAVNIINAFEKNRRERTSFGNNAMVISQYDFEGNWIASFPSISLASKDTGISSGQIARSLADSNSYANGFLWRHGKSQAKLKKIPERAIKKRESDIFHSKVVTQYDLSGKWIGEFKNLKQAAKMVGIQANLIRLVILGDSLSASNSYWILGKGPKRISMDAIHKKREECQRVIWRPVTQYDMRGVKIGNYKSIAEASRKTNVHPMNISQGLKNEGVNLGGGFLWVRGQGPDLLELSAKLKRKNELNNLYAQAVTVYDDHGKRVATYDSLIQASKERNTQLFPILHAATKETVTHKGLYWRLGRGSKSLDLRGIAQARQSFLKRVSRPVIQFTPEGKKIKEYESLAAASKATNTANTHIRDVASGKYKLAKGYVWKFKEPGNS
jgi:hypothetical protein